MVAGGQRREQTRPVWTRAGMAAAQAGQGLASPLRRYTALRHTRCEIRSSEGLSAAVFIGAPRACTRFRARRGRLGTSNRARWPFRQGNAGLVCMGLLPLGGGASPCKRRNSAGFGFFGFGDVGLPPRSGSGSDRPPGAVM
eukprot:358198-Chlamydomonas_euryale.AAC.9